MSKGSLFSYGQSIGDLDETEILVQNSTFQRSYSKVSAGHCGRAMRTSWGTRTIPHGLSFAVFKGMTLCLTHTFTELPPYPVFSCILSRLTLIRTQWTSYY